jgi:hypothetical protein
VPTKTSRAGATEAASASAAASAPGA